MPAPGTATEGSSSADAATWSDEKGFTQWYLYDLATERVEEEPAANIRTIRSKPETPRQHIMAKETLSDIRKKVE